jgi:hypothetical protein
MPTQNAANRHKDVFAHRGLHRFAIFAIKPFHRDEAGMVAQHRSLSRGQFVFC